jgi:hypothetical protein
MTDDRMTDEETSRSDARVGKFFTDVGVLAKAANQAGACPYCLARALVDAAAGIAELILEGDPADFLEREAARVRAELAEPEFMLQ